MQWAEAVLGADFWFAHFCRFVFLLQPPCHVQWSALQAVYSSASSCFLSWWNWGTVLQDRIQGMTMRSVCSTKDNVQGGRNKHKSTATVRKRQWEMGLLYIQLRTFWDKLKNPVKTTVACPAIFTPSLNRNNASPLSSLCGEAFPFPGMIPSAGISDPILCCWAYDS